MATTTALVKPEPLTLQSLLEKSKTQIALALPKHLTPERMIRVALTAVQRTPELQRCDLLSIVGAVVQASQLGLEPDGILGQAYLVPYWNGKTKRLEAQLQPGYRGLIALARRSGEVASISAEIVYNADRLEIKYGVHRDLIHVPDLDNPEREASGPRGAYATVLYKDSTYDFEYMSLSQLQTIRDGSKSRNREGELIGPWVSHETEMFRKCPIRRLAKRLPLSAEFVKAAMLDEYVDAGVAHSLAAEIESAEVVRLATEQKAALLAEKYTQEVPDESEQPNPQSAPEPAAQESAPATQGEAEPNTRSKRQGHRTPTPAVSEEGSGVPVTFGER